MKLRFILSAWMTMSILATAPVLRAQSATTRFLPDAVLDPLPTVGLGTLLMDGGLYEHGSDYWQIDEGLGDLVSMTFVDGYSLGPHFTFGRKFDNRCRIEIEPTLRYAFSRKTWLTKAAVRFFFPQETQSMIEIFGGRSSQNFDDEALMSAEHCATVSGLFGWNHYKMYDLTNAGVRATVAVTDFMQWTCSGEYQRRSRLRNYKYRSLFGKSCAPNIPENYRHPVENWIADPLLNFPTTQRLLLRTRLDFMPGSTLCIIDDYASVIESPYPIFSVSGTVALDVDRLGSTSRAGCYQRWEVSVRQTRHFSRSRLEYFVAGGCFFDKNEVSLPDFKHFDASQCVWQLKPTLSWFSLLNDYELSTDDRWIEGHGEWLSENLLLGRAVADGYFAEYLQIHALRVPYAALHTELSYGMELLKFMRVGVSFGFDKNRYDGAAFNLVLNLSECKRRNKLY